jgi:hypothetical protein
MYDSWQIQFWDPLFIFPKVSTYQFQHSLEDFYDYSWQLYITKLDFTPEFMARAVPLQTWAAPSWRRYVQYTLAARALKRNNQTKSSGSSGGGGGNSGSGGRNGSSSAAAVAAAAVAAAKAASAAEAAAGGRKEGSMTS